MDGLEGGYVLWKWWISSGDRDGLEYINVLQIWNIYDVQVNGTV